MGKTYIEGSIYFILLKNLKDKRGSLTVEAALVFPVFLCVIVIMMFFLRSASINASIDHAVCDTVKQISANSYILSFLNSLEDEKAADTGIDYSQILKDELAGFKGKAQEVGKDALLDILKGEFNKDSIDLLWASITKDFDSGLQNTLGRFLSKQYGEKYLVLKNQIKQTVLKQILESNIDNPSVDIDRLTLVYSELPQSQVEYASKASDQEYKALYEELGFTPEKDDVVLVVRYDDRIHLPVFGQVRFITIHRAVEKGWLAGNKGLNGSIYYNDNESHGSSIANITEGDLNSDSFVYVTKTGTKYHKSECLYLEKSRKPMKVEQATARGYAPCKVCVLKTAEPIKRVQ